MNCWKLVDLVLPHARRVLLYGELPGTGKSTAPHTYARAKGMPIYATTLTEETPAAELRGHFIPRNGEFVWHHGPALRAWLEGAILVLNEIDLASGDCLTFLRAILDDPAVAQLALPSGELAKPHHDFRVVATMNGHPKALPAPLRDRFPITVEITEPHPGAIAALPEDLRMAASGTAIEKNPDRRVSVRAWMEFASLRMAVSQETAAEAVFGPRGPEIMAALKLAAAAP